MKKKHCYIFICIIFGILISIPILSSTPSEKKIIQLSPADFVADRFRFNMQSHIADIIYRHPALYELQNINGQFLTPAFFNNDSLTHSIFRKTSVSLRHSDGKIKGDFLPYHGNAFDDTEINADAIYSTSKHGSIFGTVSFAKGLHSGYGWNAIRHAELYLPYIIADSTGGDYSYENYYISGGYSFRINKLYYGIGGSIRGEIASRQTDPRSANTSSWLTVDASVALPLKSLANIAIRTSYIRNKQHLHLWNWRPNQQDRFFLTYGFGYYDLQESPISFGIRRMYYIEGIQTQITFNNIQKVPKTNIKLTADAEYSFLSMKTEEASAKNLFGSDTHHINASLWIMSRTDIPFKWVIGLQTQNRFRQGKENIYETYRPDENYPSIYDFRQVDTRMRYFNILSGSMLQGKAGYMLSNHFMLEGLLGIGTDYISELYSTPSHNWSVMSIYPSLGTGFRYNIKFFECGLNSRLWLKTPIEYHYDVDGGKFRLDYQETFLPYAFYTDRSFTILSELYFSYSTGKHGKKIGIVLKNYIRKGNRPADVLYTDTPGIVSHLLSNPSSETVNNNEFWINATMFVNF